ncbi:MAG: polyprenol monophosphomannose synthase [SAR202 cluster bacterium]|jgi:dolichol-phosphate mannosyltransferase|nr:polyprenol monophosphomannose synthase [SAR202 cluster bacterium]MDP6512688.1 polyprenol monophosphomannose synthase [SAR202 cluster bacterium]
MDQTHQPSESRAINPILEGSVSVVVPTYNEMENIPMLAQRLFGLGISNIKLVIVDDGSPDGTAAVARGLSGRYEDRIIVMERESKLGLGTAYIAGFKKALELGSDYVIQMDADLSHSPEYIPDMLRRLESSDVVVGSRYTPGGGVDVDWSLKRRFLSSFANRMIRAIAGLKAKDVTSGFKAYRGSALQGLDLDAFRCRGFGFQTEVAHACQQRGFRVTEHPIIFSDRTEGSSKMSANIVFEAIWRLSLLRIRGT